MDRDWQGPVRYPDPAIEVLDKRFVGCVPGSAALERLWVGGRWNEGPVWFGDWNALLWSDIPNNRMLRWQADTGEVVLFRSPSHYANGNTRDRQGRLVTCEHGSRRVTRTEYDGTMTVLLDQFDGKPLNAPNDVVVHPDGGIWFTDPGYGTLGNYEGHKGELQLPTRVYRIDPQNGRADVVDETLEKPNGLAFSPTIPFFTSVILAHPTSAGTPGKFTGSKWSMAKAFRMLLFFVTWVMPCRTVLESTPRAMFGAVRVGPAQVKMVCKCLPQMATKLAPYICLKGSQTCVLVAPNATGCL